jgi:hypothetical protein
LVEPDCDGLAVKTGEVVVSRLHDEGVGLVEGQTRHLQLGLAPYFRNQLQLAIVCKENCVLSDQTST